MHATYAYKSCETDFLQTQGHNLLKMIVCLITHIFHSSALVLSSVNACYLLIKVAHLGGVCLQCENG